MRVKVIFNCRQCGAEVVRDFNTDDDPKYFLEQLTKGADVPPPVSELEHYREKTIDQKTAAPSCRIHECGEKCLGVLRPTALLW